ncbi:MAG: radical SAM protein [Caldiserica bacterium]|nr:radical SAM protein [Caldisericota bacterium]
MSLLNYSYNHLTNLLYSKAASNKKFFSCMWELTYKCNLDCKHCYIPPSLRKSKAKDLDYPLIEQILIKLKEWGTFIIGFTGGEPLLRKDFWKIYRKAKEMGFLIAIFTNGTLLDEEGIETLSLYPPLLIEITLHSYKEDTFDKITQHKGAFKKLEKVLEKLKGKKLPLLLKTVGMKLNQEDILETKEFILREQFKYKFDPLIFPTIKGDTNPLELRLEPEEIVELELSDKDFCAHMAKIINSPPPSARFLFPCHNRYSEFLITPEGKMELCTNFRGITTDIFSLRAREEFISRASNLFQLKLPPDSPCFSCNIRNLCPQCPGRAVMKKEAYYPEPFFCALAKERNRRKIEYIKGAKK